jgi:hypothetical protein
MAKLNAPQGYDKSQLDGETLNKLQTFIDFVNQNNDQFTRALTNQLTFSDNLLGTVVTVSAMHRKPIVVPAAQKSISAVIPLRCAGGSIRSFTYDFNTDGSANLTFVFDDFVPIQTKNATVASSHVTYQTNASVAPGDRVSVSAYGNKALNKEATVLYVSSVVPQTIVAYTADTLAATETKSSYSGDAEVAKSVTLFIAN